MLSKGQSRYRINETVFLDNEKSDCVKNKNTLFYYMAYAHIATTIQHDFDTSALIASILYNLDMCKYKVLIR